LSKNNIRLKELAKILDVSISTISKALNDSHEISIKTKQRVHKYAKQYNYKPNKLATNLKSGKTKTIGIIIPSIQNYFFSQVLFGIERIITKSSYNIIISITNESYSKEVNTIKTLSNGVVDGFIVAVAEGTQIKQNFTHFEDALEDNKQIVMFDRVVKSINCDKVVVDDYQAVYNATKYIIEKNHKKIALVTTIENLSVGKLRIEGYKNAIKSSSQVIEESLIIKSSAETIENSIEKLLSNNAIDAIIALDEESSLAALKSAKKRKLQIPNELAIIGYASEKMAKNLTPELTTINQHGVKIGEAAAKMLLNKLKLNIKSIENVIIKSTLNKKMTS